MTVTGERRESQSTLIRNEAARGRHSDARNMQVWGRDLAGRTPRLVPAFPREGEAGVRGGVASPGPAGMMALVLVR